MNAEDRTLKKKLFKIGISGSYGGLNLGDEAILQSIITQLRGSLPVEITVFSRNPKDTLKRHKVERAVDVRGLSRNEIKPEVERLDMLILGGGGILYDADAKQYLREVIIAREKKIPVMLYAIGAGPLKEIPAQNLVRDVLNEVEIITVRERGAQRLLESIGVTKDIVVTADPALLIKPEPLPKSSKIIEQIEKKRRLVAISVREPGVAAPDLDEHFYHDLLANAADYIVDRLDADVVFFPMESRVLDLQHSHAVISKMLRPQRATILKGDYTSGQILSIMGYMNFAVGMRLHFLIFAALQHVPFVALPYSSKVAGFLNDMGMQMPPIHLVNAGRLLAHIDASWDAQKELKSHIKEKLPEIQKRSKETNNILLKYIEDRYQ